MAITEVKERQIDVKRGEYQSGHYRATVRDGRVTISDNLTRLPDLEDIRAYIDFLHEVAEAIKETL